MGAVLVGGWANGLQAADGDETYVIKRGDTLTAIAKRFDCSVADLKELNNLTSINKIRAGDRLILSKNASLTPALPYSLRSKINFDGVQRSRWRRIIAHHSATKNGNAVIFGRAHRRRGMENGLAYHFVIGNGTNGTADGEIEIGPRWRKQLHGGHVRGRALNETSIGICLVGNFENTRPTAKQIQSLHNLTAYLRSGMLGRVPKAYGHKDLEPNQCPGKFFPLKAYRAKFA